MHDEWFGALNGPFRPFAAWADTYKKYYFPMLQKEGGPIPFIEMSRPFEDSVGDNAMDGKNLGVGGSSTLCRLFSCDPCMLGAFDDTYMFSLCTTLGHVDWRLYMLWSVLCFLVAALNSPTEHKLYSSAAEVEAQLRTIGYTGALPTGTGRREKLLEILEREQPTYTWRDVKRRLQHRTRMPALVRKLKASYGGRVTGTGHVTFGQAIARNPAALKYMLETTTQLAAGYIPPPESYDADKPPAYMPRPGDEPLPARTMSADGQVMLEVLVLVEDVAEPRKSVLACSNTPQMEALLWKPLGEFDFTGPDPSRILQSLAIDHSMTAREKAVILDGMEKNKNGSQRPADPRALIAAVMRAVGKDPS